MKLTKRDAAHISSILQKLKRGQDYLLQEKIIVATKCAFASTSLHFTNQSGEICYALNKEIGSELALLHTGIEELSAMLAVTAN